MEIGSGLKNKLSEQTQVKESKEKTLDKAEYANVEESNIPSNLLNEEYAKPVIKNDNNEFSIVSDIKKEAYSTVIVDDTATVYENEDRTVYENDDNITEYANDGFHNDYENDGFHNDYENVIPPELENLETLDASKVHIDSSYDLFSNESKSLSETYSQPAPSFTPGYQKNLQDSKKHDEAKQEVVSEHKVKPGL